MRQSNLSSREQCAIANLFVIGIPAKTLAGAFGVSLGTVYYTSRRKAILGGSKGSGTKSQSLEKAQKTSLRPPVPIQKTLSRAA